LGDGAGFVSSRHALVALKGPNLWLRDMDSTNGTFVGKLRVTERELLGGEVISLGPMGPALRVLVVDSEAPDPGEANPSGSDTWITERENADLAVPQAPGSDSLVLEMEKKLKAGSSAKEAVQGLIKDPERLSRMLKGGVEPARVADFLGRAGWTLVRSRRRMILGAALLGPVLLALVGFLVHQNLSYRAKLREQGNLMTQIHDLERGLQVLAQSDDEINPERVRMVHQLLAAEKQLYRIRENLRLPDRAETYSSSLGIEVHQVLEGLGKKGFIVPESFIVSVKSQIDFFCMPQNRSTLEMVFARKRRYEKMINQELMKAKLPMDFLYIAMQESMLDTAALSPNDARGLWQLVPVTARDYDLVVPEDWKTRPAHEDQRTQPRLSTQAAALYLRRLYSEFGDAALAMAAYNAGEAKLRRVLRKIEDPVNDRDFWYLYRMGLLPRETNQYVPKIIAQILIDRKRERYGFEAPIRRAAASGRDERIVTGLPED
ncbi:MAG TPA: transglycosylase SLT domain-containing protein, partial [Geothrix sp.]|nr:transglycosylase SLT domain-containing protein [Geothrix sp.]